MTKCSTANVAPLQASESTPSISSSAARLTTSSLRSLRCSSLTSSSPVVRALTCALQVDEPVLRLLLGGGPDRVDERSYACRAAGEARGQGDQHARMVGAGGQALGADAREVGHVLGQQHTFVRDGRGQHVGIGSTRQAQCDRNRVQTGGPQRVGERRRVHLVEQQPQ
jgi:hypothetical protein